MLKKILIVILVLLVAAFIGLHLFLTHGLTRTMRALVLPTAKELLKLDVTMDHVSVNLFDGAMTVHGVQVPNPSGFESTNMVSIRRCGLAVGLPVLFQGRVTEIRKATIKDAVFVIIRNKDGAINVKEAFDRMRAKPGGGGGGGAAPGVPLILPPPSTNGLVLREMIIKSVTRYMDYQVSDPPFRLNLDTVITLKNIATFGPPDTLSGSVNVTGVIVIMDQRSDFDLNGRIGPIVNPEELSFDVSGSMKAIDLAKIRPVVEPLGFEEGTVSGTITLVSRRGVLDAGKSVLRLTFKQVKLTEKRRADMRGISLPESFTVVAPVTGTLMEPRVDLATALLNTLLSEDVLNSIFKGFLDERGKVGDFKKKD